MNESIDRDQLTGNILGVAHNMKSALRAVNGYIDLLAPEKSGEICEQAKHSTVALETVIENLAFALRAYRNDKPTEYVGSAVELSRSNRAFRGKVKFIFELAGDDGICAVPAKVMNRLDELISGEAKRLLADGVHKHTVATVRDSDRICVRIGEAEIAFPCQKA